MHIWFRGRIYEIQYVCEFCCIFDVTYKVHEEVQMMSVRWHSYTYCACTAEHKQTFETLSACVSFMHSIFSFTKGIQEGKKTYTVTVIRSHTKTCTEVCRLVVHILKSHSKWAVALKYLIRLVFLEYYQLPSS